METHFWQDRSANWLIPALRRFPQKRAPFHRRVGLRDARAGCYSQEVAKRCVRIKAIRELHMKSGLCYS